MQLEQGLFKLDFSDHHAVLGVPLSADSKLVRKRYLAIARKLHPDSLSTASEADRQKASELLSKWVNPAYEALSQDKSSSEHGVVLKLKGQALRRGSTAPEIETTAAKELMRAPHVEAAYRQAVSALANDQYDQLDHVLPVIGTISELNMVYLYRTTEGDAGATAAPGKPTVTAATAPPSPTANRTAPPPRRPQATIVESYINRAQEHERSAAYGQALLEMREAVKTYPRSARCHSYLASLYLKAGQATMAKIHAKRALDIDPNDELAKAIQSRVEKEGNTSGKSGTTAKGTDQKSGGFFGIFGGKKK
jgi:tetratricopeptide (TPR) repeat protein